MKEIDTSEGLQDRSFEETLRIKLEEYFAPTPEIPKPDFRIGDLYNDYPDLPTNIEFVQTILTTAEAIRRRRERQESPFL
jgi:hypothetical protein